MVDKLNQVGMRDMEMELGRLTVVVHEAFHAQLAVHCIVRLQEQGAHMAVLKKHSLLLLSAKNNTFYLASASQNIFARGKGYFQYM